MNLIESDIDHSFLRQQQRIRKPSFDRRSPSCRAARAVFFSKALAPVFPRQPLGSRGRRSAGYGDRDARRPGPVFPLSRRCITPTDLRMSPAVCSLFGSWLTPGHVAVRRELDHAEAARRTWTSSRPRIPTERTVRREFPRPRRGAVPCSAFRGSPPSAPATSRRRRSSTSTRRRWSAPQTPAFCRTPARVFRVCGIVVRSMTARTLPLVRWLMGPISRNAGSSPSNQVSCHQAFDTESCQDR